MSVLACFRGVITLGVPEWPRSVMCMHSAKILWIRSLALETTVFERNAGCTSDCVEKHIASSEWTLSITDRVTALALLRDSLSRCNEQILSCTSTDIAIISVLSSYNKSHQDFVSKRVVILPWVYSHSIPFKFLEKDCFGSEQQTSLYGRNVKYVKFVTMTSMVCRWWSVRFLHE